MATDQSALAALLQQLRVQLQNAPEIDPELAERAQRLVNDLAATLPGDPQPALQSTPESSPPPASDASPKSLTDRLRQSVRDFEASHPTLSQSLGNIADTLAQMGI